MGLNKKSVDDINAKGKRVLVRWVVPTVWTSIIG